MKRQQTLVNGEATTNLALADRAIHYGDGLFETLAVKNGKALAFSQHLQRLLKDCMRLGLAKPDASLLEAESQQLCQGRERAVLKWIISSGQGGRGYQRPEQSLPSRIVAVYDWPAYPDTLFDTGLDIDICDARLGQQPMLAGVKHLNRLEQVLLRAEIVRREQVEGVVLDHTGNVIEGSMSNIFLVKAGELFTPCLKACGVNGIIRNIILDSTSSWGIKTHIVTMSLDTLLSADEVFFCNSIIGIWPVRSVNMHGFSVGPLSQEIRQRLLQANLIAD